MKIAGVSIDGERLLVLRHEFSRHSLSPKVAAVVIGIAFVWIGPNNRALMIATYEVERRKPQLQGRKFVFLLFFGSGKEFPLEEPLGQAPAAKAECDRKPEHQRSKDDPEGDEHRLLRHT